jgi:hypothetical protein
MNTWVLEEEPRRALAREPRGFWEEDEEEEEGSGQEVAPVIRSRIAITNYLTFFLFLLFESKFNLILIW